MARCSIVGCEEEASEVLGEYDGYRIPVCGACAAALAPTEDDEAVRLTSPAFSLEIRRPPGLRQDYGHLTNQQGRQTSLETSCPICHPRRNPKGPEALAGGRTPTRVGAGRRSCRPRALDYMATAKSPKRDARKFQQESVSPAPPPVAVRVPPTGPTSLVLQVSTRLAQRVRFELTSILVPAAKLTAPEPEAPESGRHRAG